MTFTNPLALLLIALIPVFIYLGWPRHLYRRRRDIFSLALRVVIVLLLTGALAGAQIVQAADRLAVVFLIDASDSVGAAAQGEALDSVRESLALMGPDDRAGVILFGARPLVERQISPVTELGPAQSTPITTNTDIAAAIRQALAMFPADSARRIVLYSDGRPTSGDALSAAELAAAAGVEISYVPVARDPVPEVQLTDVRVPSVVNQGEEFDLSYTVEAETATTATVTILASGDVVLREDVELEAGTNNFSRVLVGGGSGFRDFRVQVEPSGEDNFFQNNQLAAFSRVSGPPRVLLVSQNEDEVRYLRPALEQVGVEIDSVAPNELPVGLAALTPYNSVILANVPATQLTPRRMEILATYVRDLGGGLVVVGGPETYGPGGYFQTPLEEALPLEMQIRDQQRIPQLTIAYVIDRSGSMDAVSASGVTNLELAKEAIIRSIDFLQPSDRAGVVSFDSVGYWVADIQPVLDRLAMQRLVASLRSGGGTDILAGMNTVAETIVNDPSQRKHIILLTDGGSSPAGLVELTQRLHDEYDVTTSVIGIGAGAADFLQDMALAGEGNYHAVDVVENIPTIFTLETVLATRSYILEESFIPNISSSSPIINGITSSPPLQGYVATTAKQTAEVILRGPAPYNDPLLAAWQYGLGRAVAFTSDATARWAGSWVDWPGFTRFWSQAVRWTITEGTTSNLETRVEMDGSQARVIVDARDAAGDFVNGLALEVSLVDPQLGAVQIPLRQIAPGRYEVTFTPNDEGAYFLRVAGQTQGADPFTVAQTTGWVMSYSPEYDLRTSGPDLVLLEELARLTGGRRFDEDPAAPFVHNLTARDARTSLWPLLLTAALLLLPVDIAIRRLVLTRGDLQRAREALFGRTAAPAADERLAGLRSAKARANQRTAGDESVASPPSAASTPPAPSGDKPRYTPPSTTRGVNVPSGDRNVAGKLLKTRKSRDEQSE